MSSLNQVNLIGRLGQDPEVKYLPNGDAVCNLSLATSERWKDKQTQEQKEKTEWHKVVVFGKLAEIAGQYLRKGALVYFQGKLETRQWEKDGEKRYTTEIRASEMKMLGNKDDAGGRDGNNTQQQPRQQTPQRTAPQQPKGGAADQFDDDVPF
ncbi:single-strand DNA-binding protein [Microvirga lupini]|uniref:Single-stranded DNA-binding protein n=1 Tax=Microvirga lupini TaxID=420324 RepID=A0A7W4YUP1_9HYPH|nr:single-stranded DNA-binding protein [Microvirga lupini]MBB3017617.1 single-strand DNA-binding protein [Microvirga lupini]